ncbi:TolC family outer membrane protein [Endozoicomonas lisbonensis]|uniref:Adhesin transport system outer membrane protein n=1 Tax=Endozoicomonas lisbonensis TaxID=3120522 RepID=A0ABV2SL41_9GAMM
MKILRASAPALLVAAALQGSVVHAVSLEEAITQTLVSNPQAQASYNRYQASQESVKAARGGYLPTLDWKAGIGHERLDNPRTEKAGTNEKDFRPKENALILNQNLYDGLSTTNEYRKTQELQHGRKEQLRTKAESLALEVADVYLKLLENRRQMTLAKNNLAAHERIYKLIQQRTEQGVANQSDLYQIEGRLARARANMISTRNNLEDSETQYLRLVNQAADDLTMPRLDEQVLPADLEQALAIALQDNPAIHASNFDLSASQYGYDQTRGAFLPSVDLSLSQRWDKDIDGHKGRHEDTKAMLTMKYNLFRGGSDSARRQEAAYRVEESHAMQQDTQRMVRETLRIAWAAMENLSAEEPYLKKHMDASAQTVKAYQKQFELGKRTLLDLLDSENENFQAQRSYTTAVHRGLYARYRVLNGLGHLMQQLNIGMPSNWQIVDS